MSAPARVRKPTKAAQFADTAEAAGWTVERKKFKHVNEQRVGRSRRRVTATRGQETFVFTWERNPETDRDVFIGGEHHQASHTEEWSNIKAALRIVTAPEQSIRIVENAEGETMVVRLPFDIEAASDADVLHCLANRKIVWQSEMTGAFNEAWCPQLSSPHFSIAPNPKFDNAGERIVKIIDVGPNRRDWRQSGAFRAFHLSNLVTVL